MIEGIKAGADIIEVDIRATKDGVIVLAHDEHISTEHGVKRIADLSVEELNSFYKGCPYHQAAGSFYRLFVKVIES
ncbi:hypothetical protein GCM10020331_051040 [Ectobacillus funiculus]